MMNKDSERQERIHREIPEDTKTGEEYVIDSESLDPTTSVTENIEDVTSDPSAHLSAELEKKEQEIRDLSEKVLRNYAEFENVKKRITKDKDEGIKYANEGILKELLGLLDNLERAVIHGEGTSDVGQWVEGIKLTIRQFEDILGRFHVAPIPAVGQRFDPAVHQAMSQVESDEEEGTVVQELQKGFLLHDRVLRPSMVTVAISKRSNKAEDEGGHDG